ncbi:hypothetical protein H4218_001083 [Coemansia sp. IMI 209128]|nr:hypothetical protein GGI10_001304 [Coemansia sp. RSA 2530]KAJ2701996.1 hypothetical protein H4218_001083 [Coemansia sp. IMI 209128]
MATLADINIEELHTLKRKQLQSLCKKHGVKANGKSEEIIERLIDHINKGGSDNASNASDTDSDDNDDDDDQRYDSATDKVKPTAVPNGEGQDATPEKLFKVVPLLNTNPVEMDAPESMAVIDQAQFTSQVEKFTAQLEARAATIAAQMGNGEVEKYNPAYGLVVKTPRSKNATKTISFDKAHERLFSSGDSIANHWSAKKVATTPNNKRANDGVPESNKRPRVEVLFESPSVQPQSARAKRKSTRGKSMTAKAQRTAAPGASLDGSKTVAAGGRVKPAGGAAALASTKLFDALPATPEPNVAEADFAPLVDVASSARMESESISTIASPKVSHSDKKVDGASLMSPVRNASKAKDVATPAKTPAKTPVKTPGKTPGKTQGKTVATPAKTPAKTAATPAKTPARTAATPAKTPAKVTATPAPAKAPEKTTAIPSKTPAKTPAKAIAARKEEAAVPLVVSPATVAVSAEVSVAKSATPATAPSNESALPSTKPDSAISAKSSEPKESAIPVAKPSQIPMARKIAKPRSIALSVASASAPKKAASESKIQAPKKPEAVKSEHKQAATKPSSSVTASAATKPPTAQPAGFRNVESKLKSYINAKPPPPKVKAVRPSKPDLKSSTKSNTTIAEPTKPAPAPAASAAAKGSDGKDVPNYMKPTRAKEVRSKQVAAKVMTKSGPVKPAKIGDGKARFNPYNRPAKPVAAKPSAAK